jgi:lipopolysaccharide/colanic/teichoic acid biosynthesis glycosyltransferase
MMRLVDYAFALSVLFALWWVLLAAWLAVKWESPGPGVFKQPRVGRQGRIFTCFKFRTMQLGTLQAGTHEVTASSVTRVGAILRRTKIDELPQVWNILRGEMALIGPRPCLPVQTDLVAERRRRDVLDVLPGISGLAQVEGIDMSDPVRLARRDADYIALRGILPDLNLILRTARGGGQGDRVRGE